MSLSTAEDDSASEIHLPADIDWAMLDKSKFFFLGAALFSGVSAALYPFVVLKTRQQVMFSEVPCLKMAVSILRSEGFRGFYRGFGTSLMGTIPARALYMGALEITKSNVGSVTVDMGFSETSAATIANATAGLSAAMAAQLVWTPVDVVSQRLMVQGRSCSVQNTGGGAAAVVLKNYNGGIDAFRKILYSDGVKGLYRGFGISILTYAPSNAVWWASYSVANRFILGHFRKKDDNGCSSRPDGKAVVAIQGLSAAMASGVSCVVTMPIDTIKTRMQVLDSEGGGNGGGCRTNPNLVQTMRNLMKEGGGFSACYRGLGPRWASMSMSAATMVTTYEFLKRLSTKNNGSFG